MIFLTDYNKIFEKIFIINLKKILILFYLKKLLIKNINKLIIIFYLNLVKIKK